MGKKKNTKNKAAAGKQPAAASNAQPSETAVAAAATASALKSEPIATPSDIPGGFPETPSNENAKLEEKTVSINPIPASAGTGNPIKLAPGEKIPDSVTAQDVNEHVKLDKASYEKSDALPTAPALDPSATTIVPPVAGVMIPESSLPMGHQSDVNKVTINSTGPGATTASLAGQVPLESKVPAVVKESQERAGVAPEASASSQEVKEKAQVEQEIKSKIPEAPATSVGTAGVGTEKKEDSSGTIVGAAVATGGAAVAAAAAALTKLSEDAAPVINDATNATATALNNNLPASVKDKLPVSAQNALATEKSLAPVEEVSPQVPKEVKESIVEAGKSPEAAANTTAVQEKKEVESELLRQVLAAPDNHGATSTSDSKPAESKEKKAATETSTKTPSTLSPAAPSTEAKTTAAKTTEPAGAATPANGNGTEPKSSGAAHEKKKHRFSVMMNKLKAKLK